MSLAVPRSKCPGRSWPASRQSNPGQRNEFRITAAFGVGRGIQTDLEDGPAETRRRGGSYT